MSKPKDYTKIVTLMTSTALNTPVNSDLFFLCCLSLFPHSLEEANYLAQILPPSSHVCLKKNIVNLECFAHLLLPVKSSQ